MNMKQRLWLLRVTRDFFIIVGIICLLGICIVLFGSDLSIRLWTGFCLLILLYSVVIAIFNIIIDMHKAAENKQAKQVNQKDWCKDCYTAGRMIEKVHPEIPYCEFCFKTAFEGTAKLANEAEARIKLAQELGLESQAVGAKKWFEENLPEPIKWLFQQQAIVHLKQYFPQAKPFNPSGFSGFPLNCDNPAVNIPSEGLEILKGMVGPINLLPELSKQ